MNDLKEGSLADLIELYAGVSRQSLYESTRILSEYFGRKAGGLIISIGDFAINIIPMAREEEYQQILKDMLSAADEMHSKFCIPKEDTIVAIIKEAQEKC